MNREEQLRDLLKKNRTKRTKELMDFLSDFKVRDENYLFCELEYLSKVIEIFKDNLKSTEKDFRKIYDDVGK